MAVGLILCLLSSIGLAGWLASPASKGNSNDGVISGTGESKSLSQGFETYLGRVASSAITVASLGSYILVFTVMAARALYAIVNVALFVVRTGRTYWQLPNRGTLLAYLALYLVIWPIIIPAIACARLAVRCMRRCRRATLQRCFCCSSRAPVASLSASASDKPARAEHAGPINPIIAVAQASHDSQPATAGAAKNGDPSHTPTGSTGTGTGDEEESSITSVVIIPRSAGVDAVEAKDHDQHHSHPHPHLHTHSQAPALAPAHAHAHEATVQAHAHPLERHHQQHHGSHSLAAVQPMPAPEAEATAGAVATASHTATSTGTGTGRPADAPGAASDRKPTVTIATSASPRDSLEEPGQGQSQGCWPAFLRSATRYLDASFTHLLFPNWGNTLQIEHPELPLRQQPSWALLLSVALGGGYVEYENFRRAISHFTGWYLVIWFFAGMARPATPAGVVGVGIVGFIGVAVSLWAMWEGYAAKEAKREQELGIEDESSTPPLTTPSTGTGTGKQQPQGEAESSSAGCDTNWLQALHTPVQETQASKVAGRDVDPACVWGSCMLTISIIAAIIGLAVQPALGGFMILLLLLVTCNFCLPRPRSSVCGVACRLIIVVVAALYGAFKSGEADPGGTNYIVALNATVPAPVPTMSYDVCRLQVEGLNILDYCMLSKAVYNQRSYMLTDVNNWFGAANMSVAEVETVQLPSGLKYSAFRHVEGSADRVVVVIRGSKAEKDFAQDMQLWNEALLMWLLSSFGPYNSFPLTAKERFIQTLDRVSSTFQVAADASYFSDLEKAIKNLQATYNSSQFVVAGHSLGGGLSALAGAKLRIPSISISGPGSVLTGYKLGIDGSTYDSATLIMPDYDVVPRIDQHVGAIHNIPCSDGSPSTCHNCLKTCCTLVASCKDEFGRGFVGCPA